MSTLSEIKSILDRKLGMVLESNADEIVFSSLGLDEANQIEVNSKEQSPKTKLQKKTGDATKAGPHSVDDKASINNKSANEEIEDEDLTLEDFSLEELQEFVGSEEYNQLDEVSKELLGRYVKKAVQDSAKRIGVSATTASKEAKEFHSKKAGDRLKGVARATKKMSEAEDLTLEDFSIEELQEFVLSEDFQRLDELSKGTLARYIAKSASDKTDREHKIENNTKKSNEIANTTSSLSNREIKDKSVRDGLYQAGYEARKSIEDDSDNQRVKLRHRGVGIIRAINKISKESIDPEGEVVFDQPLEESYSMFTDKVQNYKSLGYDVSEVKYGNDTGSFIAVDRTTGLKRRIAVTKTGTKVENMGYVQKKSAATDDI